MAGNRPDIEAIFFAAQQAPPHERAAYLDEVCGADTDLRQRLEQFLNAQAGIGSFLEAPVPGLRATIDTEISERPGTVIGPYKLLEEIGEGGFGVVFMAEQQHPVRRKVALKVIKPGMDSKQIIARFEAERQALALMDHPNIARVLDAGATESGRPFFVMELVRGLPITEYCDQNQLTPHARLELFVAVCQAVQHAHQKGIIHRDIKPNNVLITLHDGKPVVKVIDFGIAKATGQQLTDKTLFTGFAQLIGTPLYMSPEQAALSGLDVDTRSDIYSLGVLLYELLTGTTPFEKGRFREAAYDEIRRIIREEEPPKPSTRISTVGLAATTASTQRQSNPKTLSQLFRGELDWIVMKALEKERTGRYETANAFAADVQRYLNDEQVQACPPSARYRLRKFARRNKVALATTGLVALALLLGTGVSIWLAVEATDARHLADTQRQLAEQNAGHAQRNANEAERQTSKAVQAKQDAELQRNAVYQNLYYADMRLGLSDWNAANLARLSDKLRSHTPRTGAEDLRGWEWYYLLSLCHQDERTLMDHTGRVYGVAWSPDGRYLAAAGDGTTKVWDTTSWRLLRTFIDSRSGVSWSPDSQWLAWGPASSGNASVQLWHVPSDKVKSLPGHTASIWTVAWSPDGKRLASAGMDKTIRVWEPATGSCTRMLKGIQGNISSVKWHPDGKLLASIGSDGETLKIWDAVSGQMLRAFVQGGFWNAVAWSPDGSQLALGAGGKLILYKTADWSEAAQWYAHQGAVRCVAWEPDGSRLASAGNDGLIQLWEPASAVSVLSLRGHPSAVNSVAWEPGGHRLASGGEDGTVKVWPLPPVSQPQLLEGPGGGRREVAWGDEPDTLQSLDVAKGLVTHWNVATGQRLSQTPMARGRSGQLSAGGRLAVVATDEKPPRLLICDARSGNLVQIVNAMVPRTASFSPDASQLALLKDNTVEIADLRLNEVRFRSECIFSTGAASWSADGRLLAIAGGGDATDRAWLGWVQIFDIEKRQSILKLLNENNDSDEVSSVTWRPDGKRFVSGNTYGHTAVWEVSSGHKVASARLHTARINAQAWSPDSRRVASASADRTVRIWDPGNGEELLRFDVPKSLVMQLAWSTDGRRLVAACKDGSVQIWDASQGYNYVHSAAHTLQEFRAYRSQAQELWGVGRTEEAIALLQQMVAKSKAQLGPDHPDTVTTIGELALTYERAGRRREADAVLEQALEKPNPRLERVALALLRERSQLFAEAQSRQSAQLFAAAARYYSEAFAAEPKLASEIYRYSRYNAACAAALAGCGQGKDAATLEDGERASLRRQALAWLRADLAAWRSLLDKDPGEVRHVLQQTLQYWQIDADFNGVRGAAALAKLPEAERQEWQKLWEEVEEFTKQAGEK